MNFPYLYVQQNLDSIDIEDFGNVTLQLNNDIGNAWYIIINTSLGWTTVQTFGPIELGNNIIPYHFQYNYDLEEYNDIKLIKRIDKFINDPKKMITQIFFVDKDETIEILKNLHERS